MHPQPSTRCHAPPEDPTVSPVLPLGAPPAATEGRYEWLGEMARGGMGAVHLVRDTRLGRTLAVKVLLEEHRDRPDMAQRFLEEAQITGQLQHPAIVPIHELGSLADGRPFFAMKLIRGQTLAELLAARSSPADDRARYLAAFGQVCQAVAYAHSKRVIHRDLKPANVMVGAFGEVQVMDWGLAKVLGSDPGPSAVAPAASVIETVRTGDDALRSQAGSVMGTYAYMAPEQARGEVDRLDERADVFGLGAVLCEVLTGRPPYAGATAGEVKARAMLADLGSAQAALRECGADDELVQLALACLAATPEERPPSGGTVAAAVASYQARVAERLREAETERAVAQARSRAAAEAQRLAELAARQANRAKRMMIGLLALGLLGAGGLYWLMAMLSERQVREQRIEAAVERDLKLVEAECDKDREGREANWQQADWAIYSAESQLRAHSNAPAKLYDRLHALTEIVEQGKKIQKDGDRLLKVLEQARGERSFFPLQGRAWAENSSGVIREAFREYGLHPEFGPEQDAVKRLRTRSIALEIAAHLMEWGVLLAQSPSGADKALVVQLFAISGELARGQPHPALPALYRIMAADREGLDRLASDREVLTLPPTFIRVVSTILVAYQERGAAITLLRRAVRAHPADFWLHMDLGGLLLDTLATRQEAKEQYEAALALRPDAAQVWACLTVFPLLAGSKKEAVEMAERAVRAAPAWGVARLNLGTTLMNDGRDREAVLHLRQAARMAPEAYEPPFLLCQALVSLGEWREAAKAARAAIRLHATGKRTFGSSLHFTLRQDRSSVDGWKEEHDDVLGNTYRKLAVSELSLGNLTEALAAACEALRLEPFEVEGRVFLAGLLVTLNKPAEAAAQLELAVCLGCRDSSCFANLCKLRADLGALDLAIDSGQAAVEANPASAHAWLNLGVAYYRSGRYALAAEAFGRRLQADPTGAIIHLARADCLSRLGRPAEALRHYQAACQGLPPGDEREIARRELARLRRQLAASRRS